MSTDGIAGEGCGAYACPLLGSFGIAGKWFCCCHFRGVPGTHDAVTAVLNQHRPLVDRAVLLRREGAGYGVVLAAENALIELTCEIGNQQTIPTGPVLGPTHAESHYSEASQ